MRKVLAIIVALVFAVTATIALAETAFKAGDSIYACGCGEGCPCKTLSHKAGKCGCGKPLVQASVTNVENGKVHYKIKDKELVAPAAGKYVCACGEGCPCGTVSQKPGKCGCGKDLKKVE